MFVSIQSQVKSVLVILASGILSLLVCFPTPALAVTYTWSGGDAGTGNWSSASNWDTVPVSNAATDLAFSANANGFSANNNIANPFQVNTLAFNLGLPTFNTTGSEIRLNGTRSITQNSANAVTINNNISHNATNTTLTINGTGTGDLEVAGTYFFPHQSVFTWSNGANYNLTLNRVDVFTRSSDFNNNNTTVGKELRFNGDINFTAPASDPTVFQITGAGTTVINGQFKHPSGGQGTFNINPTGGKVTLNNSGGNFADAISGAFRGAGTIDLGGYQHNVVDLTYFGANATNGTVGFQNFYLDFGTVNINGVNAPSVVGNLVKRDVTNNDAFINGSFTHTGVTKLIASDITLQGANGSVNQSSIEFDVVNRNGENSVLYLSNTTANNNNRISDTKSITMAGGELRLIGNASVATQEAMGAVTFSRQAGLLVDAAAGGVASLTGTTLTRSNGGNLYLSADSLGSAAGPNVGQILFTTAPATTAGTLGTTSAATVPWAVGSATYNSNSNIANVLPVTYDPVTGFRPLTASEYVLNTFSGASGANVRVTNNSTNLTGSDMTIKSLTFIPGSNGTFTIGGAGTETLTITDGLVVASQTNQAPVDVLNVSKLTFGNNAVTGYEGIFHVYAGGGMTVNSNIINNGANAVSLTKGGYGELRLAGTASVIGGGLRINEGGVRLTSGANLTLSNITLDTTLSGSLTLDAGSVLNTTGTGTVLYVKRPLGGTATAGGGTLNLSGDVLVDYSAVGGSTSSTNFGSNIGLGAADRTFNILNSPAGTDATFSGAIGGNGGLVKTGAGVMALSGANNYIGNTTVNAGTLQLLGPAGVLTSSPLITVATNTGFQIDNSGAGNNNNDRLSNTGNLQSNGGSLRITGNATVASSETLGTLTVGLGQTIITLDALAGGVTSFTANTLARPGHGAVVLLGDALGTAAGINVSQMYLGSAPTLVGGGSFGTSSAPIMPFFVGDTNLAGPDRNTTSFVTYDTNGFRLVNRSTEMTSTLSVGVNWFTGSATVSSDIAVNSLFTQGIVTIGGTAGRTLTVTSGMIMNASGFDPLNLNVPFLTFGTNASTGNEGIVYVNGASTGGTTTISSSIVNNGANSVSLTKYGTGALVLTGASTYTGETTVDSGTLRIGVADNRLPTGTTLTLATGATFDLNNFNQTIRGLQGTGSTTNTSANFRTLTINTTTGDNFTGGTVTGLLNLTKSGSGTQHLTGTNDYTGTTLISGGTLAVDGTLVGGPVNVNSGGTLSGTGTIQLGSLKLVTVNNGGALNPGTQAGAGTLTINGGLVLNNSALLNYALGNPSLPGDNDLVVLGDGANGNLTLDGILSITQLPGFGPGVFKLFSYTGSLTNNGLILPTVSGYDLFLDLSTPGLVNLSVVLEIPEPSSLVLLGFGALALRRRRTNRGQAAPVCQG